MPRKPIQPDLKKLIRAQINAGHSKWTGSGVEIERTSFHINAGQRQLIQEIGAMHGCHTCRTKLVNDSNQPWVGDHIPPVNLKGGARLALGCSSKTYLYPQCHSCANAQAHLVKRLNSNPLLSLNEFETKLITGGRSKIHGIKTFGKKVSVTEGQQIQSLGEREGCHSCGAKNPASVYIADHTFPQEFCTSYMEQVFNHMKLPYPKKFELRPQRPRCSTLQGGKMSRITRLGLAYARKNKLTVYKY